ncbi:unnamed protein product, partial [Pipistrellus nathusii]
MVAPAARIFLRVACAALTCTLLGLLCLTVGGAPRGLESGRLPRADQRVPVVPGSGALSLRVASQESLERTGSLTVTWAGRSGSAGRSGRVGSPSDPREPIADCPPWPWSLHL